ncbi:MAG: HEAT repeat domain-containing protein [Planctomycetaceae bacterium]
MAPRLLLADGKSAVTSFRIIAAATSSVVPAPSPELIQKAIPLLINSVNDPDSHLRQDAATLLGQIGGKSAEVRDALKKASTDSDEELKQAATAALKMLAN